MKLQPKLKFEMILKSKWDIDAKIDFGMEFDILKDTMIFEWIWFLKRIWYFDINYEPIWNIKSQRCNNT